MYKYHKNLNEKFYNNPSVFYTPSCNSHLLYNRQLGCRGNTTGPMPIIDIVNYSEMPCCGYLVN